MCTHTHNTQMQMKICRNITCGRVNWYIFSTEKNGNIYLKP